jgi:hypothetical protein
VKAPFNVAKVYSFENIGYKSLAINSAFVEAIMYTSGVVVFNAKTCK